MRVLLVNTSELIGGAAIAASRLLHALNGHGVEATMLVRDKQTDNPRVLTLPHELRQRARFLAERADICLRNGLSKHNLFAIDTGRFGADITRLPAFERADIIHLHWVNQGLLSLGGLERVLRSGKRVVWTMHDMWPFTGICHQAGDCRKWLEGCGDCPLLNKPGRKDLSRQVFHRKAKVYGRHELTFAGCSDWLSGLARSAPLLAGQRVESVPNPLDVAFYKPADKQAVRRKLGLPEEKKLQLFVAYKVTDPNKGIGYLREAVAQLCANRPEWRDDLELVAVGREAEMLRHTMAVPVHAVTYVQDQGLMADYYRAADVLAMPTLMDNLPNTIAEAMACGTPCVGFRIGGLPQMIDNGENGFLAAYKNASDFSRCLERLLASSSPERFSVAARHKAVNTYSEQAVSERFASIYEQVLQNRS